LALIYGLFVRISVSAAVQDIGALILAIQELSIVVLVLTRRRARIAGVGALIPRSGWRSIG
jgi:hypothetical protein